MYTLSLLGYFIQNNWQVRNFLWKAKLHAVNHFRHSKIVVPWLQLKVAMLFRWKLLSKGSLKIANLCLEKIMYRTSKVLIAGHFHVETGTKASWLERGLIIKYYHKWGLAINIGTFVDYSSTRASKLVVKETQTQNHRYVISSVA